MPTNVPTAKVFSPSLRSTLALAFEWGLTMKAPHTTLADVTPAQNSHMMTMSTTFVNVVFGFWVFGWLSWVD